MGHTTGDGKEGGLLYGLRADTGDVLWQKETPEGPITSFSAVRRHAYSFRRGPDGHIWSFFDKTLVRIDPRNARVEAIGRIAADPAQIAFAAGGVYIAGGNALRRIKGGSVSAASFWALPRLAKRTRSTLLRRRPSEPQKTRTRGPGMP